MLWCRDIPSGISQKETGEIEVFNPISETFHGSPGWMGGVVTQVPIPAAYPGLGADRHSLKYSGYRVECFSDVNEQDKSRSATYDYVPVQQIRPLGLWQEVMHGVPEDRWHPTIFHCLSAMATFSPIERYWFKGVWPDLNIHSKGCYLGAESIFVGDAVRILPDDKASPITDVLYVTDIVMMFRGLCRETDAMNIWEAAQGFGVEFHGYSYTLDVERSERRLLAEPQNPAMSGYGPWYHSHEPNQLRGADFSFVNGRLCEAGVLQRWFPHSSTPFMERGHNGIIEGYNYATSHDNRVQTSILPLTITNSRGEGLDMPTVNGFDINENRYISQPDVVAPWSERRQAQMPSLLWGFAPMDQSLAGIMAEAGESSRAAAGWGEEEGWMGEGWMGEGWMGEGWMEEGWMEGEEAEAETETEKRKEGEVKAILERMEVEMGFEEE